MYESQPSRRKRRSSLHFGPANQNLLYLREQLPERYECFCRVCQGHHERLMKMERKVQPQTCDELRENSSIKKMEGGNPYTFILFKLLEAANYKNRPLAVHIPETVLFENGQPIAIIIMQPDESWKVIRQKDRLTFLEIRKFFDERRKKYNNDIKSKMAERSGTWQPLDSLKIPESLRQDSVRQQNSFRRSLRSKLQNNYISVGAVLSDVSKVIQSKTSRNSSKVQTKQLEQANISKREKEICLITFTDNSSQIISQSEYGFLFQRRKIDPYWQTLACVQNLLKSQTTYVFKQIKWKNCKIESPSLYTRASKEISRILETAGRQDYLAANEEQAFRNELQQNDYLLYTIYKIVLFLHQVGLQLYHCSFFFLKDVLGRYYLMNIQNITYTMQEIPTSIENIEQFDYELQQDIMRRQHLHKQKEIVQRICIDMLANAIEMRKIQLKIEDFTKPQGQTVRKIFRLFHPEFQQNLHRIINSVNWKRDVEEEINRIRQRTQYLIHNDEGLRILHLHGIPFTKTLHGAKPKRTQSAALFNRRLSLPIYDNFRAVRM